MTPQDFTKYCITEHYQFVTTDGNATENSTTTATTTLKCYEPFEVQKFFGFDFIFFFVVLVLVVWFINKVFKV